MSRALAVGAGLSRTRTLGSACKLSTSVTVPRQDAEKAGEHKSPRESTSEQPKKVKKNMAQLDEELRAAMEGRAGDGGLAGSELEGGKQVGLKRGIKDNMFRYI